jgi:hypothetical protein
MLFAGARITYEPNKENCSQAEPQQLDWSKQHVIVRKIIVSNPVEMARFVSDVWRVRVLANVCCAQEP